MKRMTLSEFKEKPIDWQVKYDFTNDTQGDLGDGQLPMLSIINPIEQYFVYKCGGIMIASFAYLEHNAVRPFCDFIDYATRYNHPGDPDGDSTLLQELYGELYQKLVDRVHKIMPDSMYVEDTRNKKYAKNIMGTHIASDTMTSATNFVNAAFAALYYSDSDGAHKDFESIFKSSGGNYFENNRFSVFSTSALAANDRKTNVYQRLQRTFPNLEKFLAVYHSIGNFCPVPDGFNCKRSGRYASHDFWDLTLMKIKEWYDLDTNEMQKAKNFESYQEQKEQILRILLHIGRGRCPKVLQNTQAWLESFGSWDNFVEENFFQPFVNVGASAGHYGSPKKFWTVHSWGDTGIPTVESTKNRQSVTQNDMDALNAALGCIAHMIEERGKLMIRELSKI